MTKTNFWSLAPDLSDKIFVFRSRKVLHTIQINQNERNEHIIYKLWNNIYPQVIREGDIGEKLFPDFPDMKVDFADIGIGKIGKIGLPPTFYKCNICNLDS